MKNNLFTALACHISSKRMVFDTMCTLTTHNCMLTFHLTIRRLQPTRYPVCHRRESLASVALPYTFERSKNRDNSLYHTEPPHSAATSSCHRYLWTQRYHFGQHSRPWRAPRFNFVDDRTRKPYLPDCLRPTSLYSANTICANSSSMQDTCSCMNMR